MSETDSKTAVNHRLSEWLFNPFKFIAGFRGLLAGLGILLVTGLVSWLSNTSFEGVISIWCGVKRTLWFSAAVNLIDWISMVIPLILFGWILSGSSVRVMDVFGMQALARTPYLIVAVIMLPNAYQRFSRSVVSKIAQITSMTDGCVAKVILWIGVIVTFLMLVWMVLLMYRAYKVSCSVKGLKAVGSFIMSLAAGEILSKFVISGLQQLCKMSP